MKPSIAEIEVQATKVWVEARTVCIKFADGREVRFPASQNRVLRKATARQLANVELICDGIGIHWPDLDEDLSVHGILEGRLGSA